MYSPALERALRVCLVAHAGQVRRGDAGTPYAVHPLHMALVGARLCLDEQVIQAALLHDVAEDCADWSVERIAAEFGDSVASIVAELTEDKTKTWEERKSGGVAKVARLSLAALQVKALDKLHNLQCLVAQLQSSPDPAQVWSLFRGGKTRTLDKSSQLVKALETRLDGPLKPALRQALEALLRLP